MKFILKKLANALLTQFTQAHKGIDYEEQKRALQTLIAICNNPRTRKFLIEGKLFKKH